MVVKYFFTGCFTEHQQKSFVMISVFWSLWGVCGGGGGGGGGGLSESRKKEKFMTIFFRVMLSEVLKICEK